MDDRGRNAEQERLFADWVRDHEKAVRGFLWACVRRQDVVDELSQEVFCRAWQARSSYREQGFARAYLLRIADRLVCDRGRRGAMHVNLDQDGWKRHEPVVPTADPLAAAVQVEENEQLAAALDRLSPPQRRRAVVAILRPVPFCRDRRDDRLPLEHDLEPLPPRIGSVAGVVGGETVMTNDLERMQRLLEEATAAGDAPADRLDPEAASLREAWLAFGEMLEAAQPPVLVSPLLPGEGQGVRASHVRPRWHRLLATGALAASLVVGAAMIWMLHGAAGRQDLAPTTEQHASTHQKASPIQNARAKTVAATTAPQWDDSLDEQFRTGSLANALCSRERDIPNRRLRTRPVSSGGVPPGSSGGLALKVYLPSPFGRGAGGEGFARWPENVGVVPRSTLTLTLSQGERGLLADSL